jgi:uncharacterized protein (TIGR02145 family)
LSLSFSSLSQEVQIGDQIWQEQNLDVITFRNGDEILQAKTDADWVKAIENEQPAWCYYENDSLLGEKRGKLYNWYAVNDKRGIAPKGWRVPTLIDFQILYAFYDVAPSPEKEKAQFEKAMLFIERLKSDFEKTKNDSLFAYHHSDDFDNNSPANEVIPMSSEFRYDFTDDEVEKLEDQEIGSVTAFNKDNEKIIFVKLKALKEVEFGSMRYILLGKDKYPGGKTARELADSILNVIQNENNFIEMVKLFSEDHGSSSREGVYEDFEKGIMVKSIEDFVFDNAVGTIDTLTTVFGTSIVEVLNKKTEVRPVVVKVTKKIVTKPTVAHYLKDKDNYNDAPVYLQTDNKFKAVLSGLRSGDGEFAYENSVSLLWTLPMNNDDLPLAIYFRKHIDDIATYTYDKAFGLSIRCIKN